MSSGQRAPQKFVRGRRGGQASEPPFRAATAEEDIMFREIYRRIDSTETTVREVVEAPETDPPPPPPQLGTVRLIPTIPMRMITGVVSRSQGWDHAPASQFISPPAELGILPTPCIVTAVEVFIFSVFLENPDELNFLIGLQQGHSILDAFDVPEDGYRQFFAATPDFAPGDSNPFDPNALYRFPWSEVEVGYRWSRNDDRSGRGRLITGENVKLIAGWDFAALLSGGQVVNDNVGSVHVKVYYVASPPNVPSTRIEDLAGEPLLEIVRPS